MGFAKIAVTICVYWVAFLFSLGILVRILIVWWKKGNDAFAVKTRTSPPSILTSPEWGEHNYIKLKSGVKLHYVSKGDRSRPLMLLLHGFLECWFSWRHQLKEFSSQYWVVAVDMKGYGDSDKPPSIKPYEIPNLYDDIKDFIELLGKAKCTLVGHDWGAVIAWHLVAHMPSHFDCHISMNGPHPVAFVKYLRSGAIRQLLKSWYLIFFQMPLLPELTLRLQDLRALEDAFRFAPGKEEAFPDDVIEAFKYYFSQPNAFTPPINYYRGIPIETLPSLPNVEVPTLVIWGVNDFSLSKDLALWSSEYCSDSQVKYIEGSGHWVQQEAPVTVNKVIWEYLRARK